MEIELLYKSTEEKKLQIVDQTDGKYYNICIHCKKLYEADDTYDWFCSEECFQKHDNKYQFQFSFNKREIAKCSMCGRNYYIRLLEESKRCNDCHRVRNINNIMNNTIYIKNCPICGRTFSHYSEKWKYCSRRCNKEKLKPEFIKACQCCGKRFKTRDLNIFYCSQECANKYHKGEGLIQKYESLMTNKDY